MAATGGETIRIDAKAMANAITTVSDLRWRIGGTDRRMAASSI